MSESSASHMQPVRGEIDLSWLELPHPQPFVCETTVDKSQLSRVIEHASNVEYVRWLDRAAELHSDRLGYTRAKMLGEGLMWFVARHEIDYLAEAWLADQLLIATWVRDVRRVRSWREYVLIRPRDRQVICKAATLWVLVDLESRRPVQIPDEMRARFQPLDALSRSTS